MPDDTRPASWQDLITAEAQKQQVDPRLALAVADKESSFNPNAVGTSGERGLFQLMPITARGQGVDPADPIQNIRGGVGYLKERLNANNNDVHRALEEYNAGPGRTPQTNYADDVLNKHLPKFSLPSTPTARAPSPAQPVLPATTGGPPAPSFWQRLTKIGNDLPAGPLGPAPGEILREMNMHPETAQGRRNLAGAAGAALLGVAAPELGVPTLATRAYATLRPVIGAFLGGGGEQLVENAATPTVPGAPPKPTSLTGGLEQAKIEAGGQAANKFIFQPVARRLSAGGISSRISTALDKALEATKRKIDISPVIHTPSEAGQAVHAVAYGEGGAAKTVKDALGEAVGAAAETGPRVDPSAINAHLADITNQLHPGAQSTQATIDQMATHPLPHTATPAERAARQQQLAQLAAVPTDHPLPKVLAQAQQTLTDNTGPDGKVDFSTVHAVKRMVSDAVNHESPAKNQVQGATKGLEGTIRDTLRGHPPYDVATAKYGAVARLYDADAITAIRNQAQTNPSVLVDKLDWSNPEGVKLVRDLVRDVPTMPEGTQHGAQEGQGAWNAVQAAWTHENIFAKGPAGAAKTLAKINASGQGKGFIDAMYGDTEGKRLWQNTNQLVEAWQQADTHVRNFAASDLSKAGTLSDAVKNAAIAMLPAGGHSIGKLSAISRFVGGRGAGVPEMLEHAAHSDATTQFLVKHVLTGPDPGMALADFMRWYQESGGTPEKPMPSHAPTNAGGPPVPASLSAR